MIFHIATPVLLLLPFISHAFTGTQSIVDRRLSRIQPFTISNGCINTLFTRSSSAENVCSLNQSLHVVRSTVPFYYNEEEDVGKVGKTNSFEKRMRNIALGRMRRSPLDRVNNKKRKMSNQRPKNVQIIETLQDYKKVVGEEDTKLVVVRFFATWCKVSTSILFSFLKVFSFHRLIFRLTILKILSKIQSCRAMAPGFYRMANLYPNVLFIEVPVTTKNADLHQGLEVPSVPFGHIYHPQAGLVEEMKISKKFFSKFEDTAMTYVHGYCDLLNFDSRDNCKPQKYNGIDELDDYHEESNPNQEARP